MCGSNYKLNYVVDDGVFQAFDDIMDHSNVHCIFPKLALGVKQATFFLNGPNYMVCTHVGCSYKGVFNIVYRVHWFHAIRSIKEKCTLVVVDPIKELEQRFLAQDIMNITRDL